LFSGNKGNEHNLPGGVVGCVVGVVRTGGTERTVNINVVVLIDITRKTTITTPTTTTTRSKTGISR